MTDNFNEKLSLENFCRFFLTKDSCLELGELGQDGGELQ